MRTHAPPPVARSDREVAEPVASAASPRGGDPRPRCSWLRLFNRRPLLSLSPCLPVSLSPCLLHQTSACSRRAAWNNSGSMVNRTSVIPAEHPRRPAARNVSVKRLWRYSCRWRFGTPTSKRPIFPGVFGVAVKPEDGSVASPTRLDKGLPPARPRLSRSLVVKRRTPPARSHSAWPISDPVQERKGPESGREGPVSDDQASEKPRF